MPKLSIYVDETTRRRVERAARRECLSASKWVRSKLVRALENNWPKGYFDLFGRLAGERFERPKQGKSTNDTPRKSL